MTWNDRWETKLFLGDQGTARWNGSEMNNLNQVQSSWRYLTFHPTLNRKLFFIFFLILTCTPRFAQCFLLTFNFLADWNCWEFPPPPHLPPALSELSFVLIHFNFWTVTKWNLKWQFFFPDSQKCFERKGVGVFSRLCLWTDLTTSITSRTWILIREGQKVTIAFV